ncbi:MFS transporter [Oscillochloris sp. ZM17-4]|uniref:MFS transporter n=1 Tax=Oscillochloris sp. ZM17-4 TaxID=2866714 RepID=UPI0021026D0E|nr:MFS transporter [Oscillochloris sp. ZM17-4]
MLRALRHRNYRLLFFGQLVSIAGVWMQSTAQGWLVNRLTESTFWLGMVAAAQSLPVLLLSLSAGAMADRVPKRTLLLITQGAAMASALTLAALTLTGVVQVWMVLVLALVLGLATTFEGPARQAFTIDLVGREDLLNAIGLDSTMFNGARVIGPALAGVVIASFGEGPAFLYNGLSYGAVIAGLLLMRLPPNTSASGGAAQRRRLRDGLGYIAHNPQARLIIAQLAVLCVFCLAYIPLLPSFASAVLGGDAMTFGGLASSNAAGALVAAIMIAALGDRLPRVRLRSVALLAYAPVLAAFTLSRYVPLSMLLLAMVGWCGITTLTLSNTLLQLIVPDGLRGRVMAVYLLLIGGVAQIAGLLLGSIAQVVGDVALTVRVWTAIGWFVQLGLLLSQGRALREPVEAPQ